MTKLPATFTARQAANQVAKGASIVFQPVHAELLRDYYFKNEEAARGKLASFNAEYGLSGGTIRRAVRVTFAAKRYVQDRSGYCRPLVEHYTGSAYIPVVD